MERLHNTDRENPILSVRVMVVVLNCFQLAGAFLYLTASSPLVLLTSRLVSGCGKCISVIFLVGTRTYPSRFRSWGCGAGDVALTFCTKNSLCLNK